MTLDTKELRGLLTAVGEAERYRIEVRGKLNAIFTPEADAEYNEACLAKKRAVETLNAATTETLPALLNENDTLKERVAALEAGIGWYADQFCEFGQNNTGCGKYDSDVCSGCKAVALLHADGGEVA